MSNEAFREKCRKRMMGNTIRRGKKMPSGAKAAISASLIGNQRRKGKSHPPEIKAQIAKSMRLAFAEGRHAATDPTTASANLAAFNAAVKEGSRRVIGWKAGITACPQGHPYSGPNLGARRNGDRYCRECARAACRRSYWRHKQSAERQPCA